MLGLGSCSGSDGGSTRSTYPQAQELSFLPKSMRQIVKMPEVKRHKPMDNPFTGNQRQFPGKVGWALMVRSKFQGDDWEGKKIPP